MDTGVGHASFGIPCLANTIGTAIISLPPPSAKSFLANYFTPHKYTAN